MLVILATHPIQYQVPLWQALARDARVPFEVWYLTDHGVRSSYDREFGASFSWDLDSLSGYPHKFLRVPSGASPASFWGCRLAEHLGNRLHAAGARALWFQGWQVAAYWQAAYQADRAGVELWLRAESNNLAPRGFLKESARRVLLGELFRRIDRFLCIGVANRRLYESFGVPGERLFEAPYAIDNQRFTRQLETLVESRSALRRQWGIPDGAFCVMFCGKFIQKKRPLDLVEAAKLMAAKSLDVHLLFVGSGAMGAILRDQCDVVFDSDAESSGIATMRQTQRGDTRPKASFTGFLNQTEISKAYAVADCLVLPSEYAETWGLVVNEAMASGVPCLISDRCGSAADLGHIGRNRVFPCGDMASLARNLEEMSSERREPPAPAGRDLPSFGQTIETVANLWNTMA
jgi:glycosyltransferase involved in cell wall biosynthesis